MHVDRTYLLHPLKTKWQLRVVHVCVDKVYAKFGGSLKILSDNGMEFKNHLFHNVTTQLGWNITSTPLLIIHNQMEELKDFITF